MDCVHACVCLQVNLSIEEIRQEVEDYAARAYKMGKANKEVRQHMCRLCNRVFLRCERVGNKVGPKDPCIIT